MTGNGDVVFARPTSREPHVATCLARHGVADPPETAGKIIAG
jgi:hypothetical protein